MWKYVEQKKRSFACTLHPSPPNPDNNGNYLVSFFVCTFTTRYQLELYFWSVSVFVCVCLVLSGCIGSVGTKFSRGERV